MQSLAIKLVMLAITTGIIYWALSTDSPEQVRVAESTLGSEDAGKLQEEPPAAKNPGEGTGRKVTALTPTSGAPSSPRAQSSVTARGRRPVTFPIDINTAGREELVELPGIGEKLAGRIMEYRKAHAGFQSIEDLRKVKGIGKKRMERLRPLVKTAA